MLLTTQSKHVIKLFQLLFVIITLKEEVALNGVLLDGVAILVNKKFEVIHMNDFLLVENSLVELEGKVVEDHVNDV